MANFNFNKVILGGRLTEDPELKTTPNGLFVTTFTIAVNRPKTGDEQKTDFFKVTAWRKTAEFISKYFHKASSICIVGKLQNRSWTDDNGVKHYATDIIVDEAMFVDSKGDSAVATADTSKEEYNPYIPNGEAPNFEEISDDDELPF